jgi:hypothetical protein
MRELTPETITDAVLDQMATTPDVRMKEVMAAAVRHLHAFAREVNLTPGEWIKGIEFMTLVGKMCTPARQEFILLSDTLGLSALVNGLHDKTALEEGTHTSLLGPFYREAAPKLAAGTQIAKHVKPGTECPWRTRPFRSGRLAPTAFMTSRRTRLRSTIAACSNPMRAGFTSSAPSSRAAIRSRWTARSAPW